MHLDSCEVLSRRKPGMLGQETALGSTLAWASRGVSSNSVAKQSISEESRLKVSSALFTSSLVRFGNSNLWVKIVIWGPPRPMQCQTTS